MIRNSAVRRFFKAELFNKQLLIFITGSLFGQLIYGQTHAGRITEEIKTSVQQGQHFIPIQLLNAVPQNQALSLKKTYSKASYWNQDPQAYSILKANSPSHISLQLTDYQNRNLTILLEKQELFGAGSKLLTSEGSQSGLYDQSGFYYRGMVKEYPGSIAAISFFEDQTMGVLALPEQGNLILGKMKPKSDGSESDLPHVLYYENELTGKSNFQCGADLLPQNYGSSEFILSPDTIYSSHCKTTKVFLECDYKLYQDYNRSVSSVKNYITGLFNVVKALYYNEYITIEISDIMVWTTQDPYLHTDLASIIYNYAAYRKSNFTGNLAQLVTTYAPQQQGGIAFLGTLCQPFDGQSGPHSFAYIYNSYSQLPTYSWSVEVMTHEMGHNFGSPHTHACAWGPNRNMTLDNCQNPENNACAPGPAPTNGGTIMSYCHLTSYGINFSNGFGKEPGDLIRKNVEVKTCLSSYILPTIVPNIAGPYYDADNIILKARPGKSTYSYDWYHYDYLMSTPKDSILRPTYSGIYKAAISANPCTEYSAPDTIKISDFLVNLGCPVIHGFRDSIQASVTLDFKKQGTLNDTLTVPDSLYAKVPAGVKDILVELHTTINAKGNSWLRDVTSAYQGPSGTGISGSKYAPNSGEAPGSNGEKTYVKILGRFNPKGDWYFTSNYGRFVNGTDTKVTFAVVISWRLEDSIPPCDIALCDGDTKVFDAGIPGAKYLWSTGATTKTISTNQTGPLSVQVTKGNKKASHSVNLYNYQTHYTQSHTLCEGDTMHIGKHHYTISGMYNDTLISSNGCDSIITSSINVLPTQKSDEYVNLCYGEMYDSIAYYQDTRLVTHHADLSGCDSLHFINIHVNPAISIQSATTPACPEIGGSIEVMAGGGSGLKYKYEWSNGKSTSKIDSVSSGIYQVKVIDSAGCSLIKEIELRNLDSAGFVSLVFNVSCFGKNDGRIYLDFVSGPAPFIINWSNGEHTKDIFQLTAGKYSVLVQDAHGCQAQRVIEVGSPELLLINLDVTNSTGKDGAAKAIIVGGTPPYHYEWSTGETTTEISDLAPGNYSVKVIDQNGCESRFDFVIQRVLSTQQTKSEQQFEVFPVPVKDRIILMLESSTGISQVTGWKIYDVHSRVWNEGILNSQERQYIIDATTMQPGVYIVELTMKGNALLRKMILKD
jgi:hypothetical protein